MTVFHMLESSQARKKVRGLIVQEMMGQVNIGQKTSRSKCTPRVATTDTKESVRLPLFLRLNFVEESFHLQVLERKYNWFPNLCASLYTSSCRVDRVKSKEHIDIRLPFDIAMNEVVEPEIIFEKFFL